MRALVIIVVALALFVIHLTSALVEHQQHIERGPTISAPWGPVLDPCELRDATPPDCPTD